ncbi:hypothetical protein MPTK1_5g15170 [Marchantia polymorpha subsp. ruderalis]|uniref:Amine oxidase domain-containing protein n=2 Tax=Marchantia polymorpha TaxID=3197 RepID=A0AAF6BIK6_MARPO|nr:hypothetical protein MARPO_0071s0093 [Marchantia polymorpha]BBN11840.1 hypothetical protein Mp_5g15170 [Marchantia polymorpha subsp. ruderalis]|eukprot:PTQ35482.1 hypothetical protein MARPO_0071s0093 [Marchantia polymorpha]
MSSWQKPRSNHDWQLQSLLSVYAVTDRVVGQRNVKDIEETNVIFIGSEISGFFSGGLLARKGDKVLVLESHTIAGGSVHLFDIEDFHFDSGPSLFSGLTSKGMHANPLTQVQEALNCTFGIPSQPNLIKSDGLIA